MGCVEAFFCSGGRVDRKFWVAHAGFICSRFAMRSSALMLLFKLG